MAIRLHGQGDRPVRYMPEEMWDLWESGQYVGDDKPVTRAVIQKAVVRKYGIWRSLVFGQTEPSYEIPNIQTVTIDTRHQSDAASMTMTLLNQIEPDVMANLDLDHSGQGIGPTIRSLGDLAQPGYYSFRRGITPESQPRWGHDQDPVWVDMLIPNRLIRTFQGWGTDGAANPWDDTSLILTGTWLIDNVEYTADGKITINCRNPAKLLIEQRLYPPIVPVEQYPLEFCATYTETTSETIETETTTGQEEVVGRDVANHLSSGWDSSSAPWYGYNGSVYGHRASHAFDGDTSSYWLSVGNSGPNEQWSFEWIGADTRGEPVNQVRFKPKWGGYVTYVAVKENGTWQGNNVVPYGFNSEPAYPNGSNKRYVKKVTLAKSEDWVTIDLPRTYNADQVWLIFTNLQWSGLGTYKYRAAVYEMEVRSYTPSTEVTVRKEETRDIETIIPGNIRDYTDIIKILASLSGFFWPYGESDEILRSWEEDYTQEVAEIGGVPALLTGNGRAWGDFFYSGAYPVEPPCIPSSFWDNKSVMDAINQVKEILGFICYVDATGGLVWRMPNIWRTGNFITGYGFVGPDSVREVDEEKVLFDYGVTIDDSSLRSEIHVVSAEDPTLFTSIQPGWSTGEVIPSAVDPRGDLALLGGQDRILLIPNYPFISQEEVDKFAYLVSLWIHWSYRKGKVRIPGNPAFEPDDQVRIYERVTEESYVHYIQGLRSTMDLDKGTWYLDIDTHWLGNGPDETWHINTYNDMPPALFEYLCAIGAIDCETLDESVLPEGDYTFEIPDFPDEVPRLDTDLDQLFPDPPAVNYPYDDSWSDEDIANDIGSGWATDPTPSGGGSVNHRSEAWRYSYWGSRGSNLTTFTFMYKYPAPTTFAANYSHPGQTNTVRTTVPSQTVTAYRLMAGIFADEGYNVYSCTAFAGTSRKIANTNVYSAHAWGLAIDINPNINECCTTPWSTWYARSNSPTFYAAAKRITSLRTNSSNTRVFGWGGYWSSKKDYMHFEIVATPAQLAEGVSE